MFFSKTVFRTTSKCLKNIDEPDPTHLNVYLIPGMGTLNINESSPRDQSSDAL